MAIRDRDIAVDAGTLAIALETVNLLGYFQLVARRHGYRIVLTHATPELIELIELAGLSRALPTDPVRTDSRRPRC
jgi:ribosome biogenesis SPOUT family RNA methylase Rps3